MACPKYLRTDLNPTAQQGGVWTYMGYNTVSSTGPFNMSPVTPLVQIPAGGNFPNDNPLVDPSNASLGFYQFRYSISRAGCAPSIKFITLQVQPKANAGVDFSQVICSDATPFSLQTLFNTNDGVPYNQNGVITVSPSIDIGTFPTYTLNPASVPAGVYTLTRTVEWPAASGFTRQCEDCVDSSVATLSIVPAAASGTPAFTPQLTVCSFATPLDMATTITGEASTGNWYLVTAAAGQPTYSFVNMTVNSNLFNNVTQNFATGTQLTNQSSALTVNLQTAQRGRVYRFRYITAEGTSCQAQTDVLIYPMDPPLSGTATNETICYHNLPTPSAFPIYSWLTGATSTGSWSIATNPARPNRVIQHWAQGVTSPFAVTRGSDDTFNFQSFRNTALIDGLTFGSRVEPGSAFDFTFTYTNAPPSGPSTGCTTATTTFTKRIIFTYNPGATDFTQNNPYQVNCTNQAFSLSDLVSFEENGGQWHVAPTQLAPTSVSVPNLIVGTNSPATFTTGSTLSSDSVNFANVPNGTYVFLYRGGSRWDSAEPQCQRNTLVYVTKNCCTPVNAGITNNTGTTVLNCNTTSISLTATGGVSYLWSNGATTPTITVTAPATYTVTVTGPDGCTGTASITITENTTPPNAGITNNTGTTVLNCTTTSISLTATGGGTYQWTNSLGTNPNVTITQPGTYSVTVTAANGCTSTASITITQSIVPPTIAITSPTTELNCSTLSIVLTASGAVSYVWSTGATTPSITVTQAGTYSVTGTGANGCTATQSIVITTDVICPCNSDVGVFLLRGDIGPNINPGTAQITSFIVDGVQQVSSPVSFNRLQNVAQSFGTCRNCSPFDSPAPTYNMALVNALTDLAIPCFIFQQPTSAEATGIGIPSGYSTCNNKYVKVLAPSCINWSITIFSGPNATDSNLSYSFTWANVGGVVSVTWTAGALFGVNTFPNGNICDYGRTNNVVPLGTQNIC